MYILGLLVAIIVIVGSWTVFMAALRAAGFKVTSPFKKDAPAESTPNEFMSRSRKPTTAEHTSRVRESGCVELDAVVDAFYNEGYMDGRRVSDADLIWIEDDILAEMIGEASKVCRLEHVLPKLGLRYRKTPDSAPAALRNRYTRVILTPTHAICFK